MKKYIGNIILLAAIALGASSCKDYPDAFVLADGSPTVNYVRYANRDVLIDQAYMGEVVCFVGDNLCSVHELFFNDQKALLNTSFMTEHTLVVEIPSAMPGVQTDKVYMVNKNSDTTVVDFKVLMPAPALTSMTCEYQAPGTEVTVYGRYLIEAESITFEEGSGPVVTRDQFTSISMTEITFTIPADAGPGKLRINTPSGMGQSTFMYMDNRGMLFDFDNDGDAALATNEYNCWHKRHEHASGTFPNEGGIDGYYFQFGDGVTALDAAGGWNDGLFAMEYWCGDWSTPQNITSGNGPALFNLVDFTNYSTMALKFEMYIPSSNPWMSGAMQIAFQPVSQVTVSGNPIDGYDEVAGANAYAFNGEQNNLGNWGRALYRPWESTGSFDTGDKWITVTVPISSFTYNKDGGSATMGFSSADDFASLTMFVVGGGVEGTECTPVIRIDNIRAVPMN